MANMFHLNDTLQFSSQLGSLGVCQSRLGTHHYPLEQFKTQLWTIIKTAIEFFMLPFWMVTVNVQFTVDRCPLNFSLIATGKAPNISHHVSIAL